MICQKSYNVLYIRHYVKVIGTRTYSTNKYRDKRVSPVCINNKNNQSAYGTIQGIQTPSVSLPPGRDKSRSNTAPSWKEDCIYSKNCREFGSAVTGACRKNREIIKRTYSGSVGRFSQKRGRAWLRRVAGRRSNWTTVLIVWRLKNFLMYIRSWFRRREQVEPKEALI